MDEIRRLCRDGFSLEDIFKLRNRGIDSVAFLSLNIALKSYMSTYKNVSICGSVYLNESPNTEMRPNMEYIKNYSETITHFQHFFELVFKDILRTEHELLVLEIVNKHDLLYKMLQNESVKEIELEGINTISFKVALDRLCALIDSNRIDKNYSFIKDNKREFESLNTLRNRIWHRGRFVMNYRVLDLYIGRYILPIVKQVANLPKYIDLNHYWKYKPLELELDPIDEIIIECTRDNPKYDKIAFLKELGRASYDNPLSGVAFAHHFDEAIKVRSSLIAKNELVDSWEGEYRIIDCPVCGVHSLVKYEESDFDYDGNQIIHWTVVWNVKCFCCSLEYYRSGLKNPKEYGYNFPNLWD